MGLLKERLRVAGLAFIGAAALFPYHWTTLQAVRPGAALWLALLALAVTLPAFAIVIFRARALLARRAPLIAAATVAGAALLTAAQWQFAQAGVAAVAGLALVQSFLIVLFFAAACCVVKTTRAGPDRPQALTLWTFVGLCLAVGGFSALWLLSCNFVWYYDFVTYALLSHDLTDAIHDAGLIVGGAGAVQNSLKFEYNMVPIAPIALVEALAGKTSRLFLILGIAALYVAPTLAAGALLLRRCAPFELGGRTALLLTVLAALIFPIAFFPSLYGQPDIGGVGILATLLYVAFRRGRSSQDAVASMIVVGGLLILLFVFRRWYVFLAPAILAMLAVNEFRRQPCGATAARRLFATFSALALFGSFAALCGFAFVWDRLLTMASADYVGAYKAWANPAPVEMGHALDHFGYGPLALFLFCALYLIAHRATRVAGLAALATPLLVVTVFESVQGFGVHHYLLLIPCMVFAVALAAARMATTQARARAVFAALAICAAASLSGVALPGAGTPIQLARLVPTVDMTPPRRVDMAEIDRLTRDLARHADAGEKVCVVAATGILNATIIRENAANLTQETRSLLGDNLIYLGEVDRRDAKLLPLVADCDVAVVTDPAQIRLATEEQQLVAYLDAAIKSGAGLGAAFQPTEQSYRLGNGVQARLYRRTAPIAPEDLRSYADAVAKKRG